MLKGKTVKIIVCDDEKEYLESVKNILDNIAEKSFADNFIICL